MLFFNQLLTDVRYWRQRIQFFRGYSILSVVLILIINTRLSAQQTVISGTVRDAGGESLPGVSVLLKGTTNGTVTDVQGRY